MVNQDDYNALVAENTILEQYNIGYLSAIDNLNLSSQQNIATNQALATDVTLLLGYIETLLNGVSNAQEISEETQVNLSSIADISQNDIDGFVLNFNSVINNLNTQISTLTESLANAESGVVNTLTDSSPTNDRYIFTYVGNIPDVDNVSNGGIFRNSYKDIYSYGLGIGRLAISRISSDFAETQSINSDNIISNSSLPGLVNLIGNSSSAGVFYSSNSGFAKSYNSLVGSNSVDDAILSPDFAFVKYSEQDAILAYKYNFSTEEFEAYKITYLTGDELIHNNNSPNNSSSNIGEAGVVLDSGNVWTYYWVLYK